MTKAMIGGIIGMILVLILPLAAEKPVIPDTPAGKMLTRLLQVLKEGSLEDFVAGAMSQGRMGEIPPQRHLRFLQMMRRVHGGFEVFAVVGSEPDVIEVIGRGEKSDEWRRILIKVKADRPDAIAGMDIDTASPPPEYLATLPEVEIRRPDVDDSVVKGDRGAKIDAYMTRLESVGYAGALGIVKAGEPVLIKGYGYADREQKRLWDRKTLFTIGSITKQFTGAALVKLEAMGKISFQDPIGRYFQRVPDDKTGITLHQLLTHTAGFPGAIGDDREKISRDPFVRRALAVKLAFPPGEGYHYSNVGYSLAAAILEKVTGQTYEEFLRRHLLLPAGLRHTGYGSPDWRGYEVVTGYRGDRRWGKPTEILWGDAGPGWHLQGNGGILSTVDDMLRWGEALLGERLFTDDEKKTYLSPYVAEGPGADSYYAYGWVRMKSRRGTDVITHNGGNPYIQNDMYIYPEEQVILFITSSNGRFSAIDQSGRILEMIFEPEATLPQNR